jgi:hypothetical protein
VNGAAYFATAVSYKRTFLQNLHLTVFSQNFSQKMLNGYYYRGTLSAKACHKHQDHSQGNKSRHP